MRTLLVALVLLAGCKHHDRERPAMAQLAKACHAGDLGCPRTILYVSNLAASQRYYQDRLGFTIDWAYGDPPDFGAVHRGDTQLFMCQQCQGHPGSWLWVFTPNVDKLYDELKRRGAIIKEPPQDRPWGAREMVVADPDDNSLRLASPLDDDE